MEQTRLLNQANELVEYYVVQFKELFGATPHQEDGLNDILRPVIREYGLEKSKELVFGYLRLDDDWIIKQGYSLKFFPKRINTILVQAVPRGGKDSRPDYYVGEDVNGLQA